MKSINSKVLASIMIIGLVALSAAAGTFAAFNDSEVSKDNVFTSGIIDLKIDCTGDTIFAAQDDGADETLPKFFNYCSAPDYDIKPGDCGEVTISLHLEDSNDALLYMNVTNLVNTDPCTTEPEADAEGDYQVNALSDQILVFLWEDNSKCSTVAGDNVWQEECEAIIFEGTLTALAAEDKLQVYTGVAVDGSTHYVGFEWIMDYNAGNEHQSDRTNFDVEFYAEQTTAHTLVQCPQDVTPDPIDIPNPCPSV